MPSQAPNSQMQRLRAVVGQIRTLGMRMLILTIICMAILHVAIITAISRTSSNSSFDQSLLGPPVVRQAAAAARLLDDLSPDQRRDALVAITSPSLRLSINPDFSATPPVENPVEVFVPIIAAYASVLEGRPFSVYQRDPEGFGLPPAATLADDLIIVMRLADGSGLVVESGEEFRRLVGLYGLALVVAFISLMLVGLMMWASLAYAAPLGRLAIASRSVVQAAQTASGFEPLPETGPKPVRELAAALNLAGEKLVRLMVERTTTLAAVAHDLRTYLTRLRIRSEMIEDPVQREKTIRDIEDMTQLIEDTLTLGKSVSRPPEVAPTDLAEWLTRFAARRKDMGEAITLDLPQGQIQHPIAQAELSRVLNNLLDNALRYAGAAQIRLRKAAVDSVTIDVVDEGPGVPEPFLERMSDPFTRLETSRSRDTGGAGLGLAISKALVEELGGTLTLSNRAEGGFSARITLTVNTATD